MIEHGLYLLPLSPPMVARQRAVRECGCTVLVGVRIDSDPPEPATGAIPCSDEHIALMDRFNAAFAASLENPTDRLLIDVVDEMLEATS